MNGKDMILQGNNAVRKYDDFVLQALDQADRCLIKDQEDLSKAFDLLKLIKVKIKRSDDERKELVAGFNDGLKKINGKYKENITSHLEKAKDLIEKKLEQYLNSETEIITKSFNEFGTTTIKEKYDFDVTDITKIPLEYLKIDDKKIKKTINDIKFINGSRQIPGIEIKKGYCFTSN